MIPAIYSEAEQERILAALWDLIGPEITLFEAPDQESSITLTFLDIADEARHYIRCKADRTRIRDRSAAKIEQMKLKRVAKASLHAQDALSKWQDAVDQLGGLEFLMLEFVSDIGVEKIFQGFTQDGVEFARALDLVEIACSRAVRLFATPAHREADEVYNQFFSALVMHGQRLAGHPPTYTKYLDSVSGPWIEYLLACIKPVRPHTEATSLAGQIDRYRKAVRARARQR